MRQQIHWQGKVGIGGLKGDNISPQVVRRRIVLFDLPLLPWIDTGSTFS